MEAINMESVYKSLILIEAKNLINTIKDNKEFRILVKELEYFLNLQEKNITNEVLDELQALMSRIKKLLELDKKVKEKEDIIKLYEEISLYFKEQEIRKDDLERIKNGEIFKIVEEIETIGGTEVKELDLIFISRPGANKYKKEHKEEYKGILKIIPIDNKDELLEKILRIIEKNY